MAEWHETPESSNVAGFGYEGGVLTVEFKGGDRYSGAVGEHHYQSLIHAPSKGSHIARELRGILKPA